MRLSSLAQELQNNGHRMTRARAALIDIFSEKHTPLSATQLQTLLAKKGIEVNKTTIYREIDFLIQQSTIHTVAFDDNTTRYELASHDHHHHIQCTECGNVIDLPLQDELAEIERNIRKTTGFTIKKHALEFFGLCPQCKK